MTAIAVSLFALGALTSIWVIVASWMRHGRDALGLRARLEACPVSMVVTWKVTQRVPMPPLAALRADRKVRSLRPQPQRPGLDWPGAEHRPLERAA